MRVTLTSEQRQLQASLRRLFTDTCATNAGRVDRGPGVSVRVRSALASAGMLGLPYPEHLGGAGAGLVEAGLLCHEAGRALCPSGVYTTLVAGLAIERAAEPGRAEELVPALAVGRASATSSLWSAEDARVVRPALTARRTSAGVVLDGTARFVENATVVDHLLVSAVIDGSDEWVLALLQPGASGVEHQQLNAFGRDPVGHVVLTGVTAEVVGSVSGTELTRIGEIALALQCLEMVGGAERVLDDTVAYVKRREQFGRPIASFQAVQHIVADLRIALDGARLSAWRATWEVGRGEPAARAVAIAKLHCGQAYPRTTLQCHQLTGGMGFLRESDLHLWSERAKASAIRNGTPDIALGWLADDLDARNDVDARDD